MHHVAARRAIPAILQGTGFGERALALALAAQLERLVPEPMRARLIDRAAALPNDDAPVHVGPAAIAPIPVDQLQLCTQLAPLCVQHPAQIGLQLACLDALADLWPHVSSDERPHLRARFINSVIARQAPAGSMLTTTVLREWQRDLPTGMGESPNVAALKGVIVEASPQDAYRALAEHLGNRMDIPTLSWVLGALATSLLCNLRDRPGHALQALLGTVACERITPWTPPEDLAVLVSQVAYQLWWTRNRAGLPQVRACLDTAPCPLADAVHGGDLTTVQRAARNVAKTPEAFWGQAWRLLDEWIDLDDRRFLHALYASAAVARRTGPNAISPDDAAAWATVLAEMVYDGTSTAIGVSR